MGINVANIERKTKKAKFGTTFSDTSFSKDFSLNKKLKAKQKEVLYKDLATLLAAGVDFKTALGILSNQQKSKFLKDLIRNVQEKIISGTSFHEALQKTGQFTAYEYYSVKIGEETKKLNVVLLELHKYYKRQIKLRKQVISVITYPAFVLVLTIGVLYFMLTYVVPMFKSVFDQFDADLPPLTKSIISLSEKSTTIIMVLMAVVLLVFGLLRLKRNSEKYKSYRAKAILKIPYFGKLVRKIYLARFCQFLDLLLKSKTPLADALDMVGKMIGFYPIESSINPIKRDIVRGVSLSKAMEKHTIYDYKFTSMVAVAEEINELDTMFSRLADEYDEEVEHGTKMIGVVLEPVIIIFIGFIVGIIMIAMYAPMFDLSKIINGA